MSRRCQVAVEGEASALLFGGGAARGTTMLGASLPGCDARGGHAAGRRSL